MEVNEHALSDVDDVSDATFLSGSIALSAQAVSSSAIDLFWSDVKGEDGYRLERRPMASPSSPCTERDAGFSLIASPGKYVRDYRDSGLLPSTSHCYRIRAYKQKGSRLDVTAYAVASATTLAADVTPTPTAVPVPAAPGNFSAQTVSANQIDLSWLDLSTNESGFRIERCQGNSTTCGAPPSNFALIATLPANSQSYADSGLAPSTMYFYRLYAFNAAGNSTAVLASATTQTGTTIPNPPSNLRVTSVLFNQVSLAWNDNSPNESGFKIERCLASSCSYSQIGTTGAGIASYTDPSVFASTSYNYRVRAYNSAGDSGYSNVLPVTTPQSPNQNPIANAGADQSALTQVTLTFNGTASSDPDGDPLTYSWNFGDGTPNGSGAIVTHAYASSGSTPSKVYTVTLTVSDGRGGSATATARVTINNRNPIANAGANQTGTAGVAVTLNGSGSNDPDGTIVGYSWSFGDGTPNGSGAVVSHTYATAGTYNATLTVTDNSGGSASAAITVSISPPSAGPPPAPYNLSHVILSSTQIELRWNAPAGGADGFRIEWSSSYAGPYTLAGTVGGSARSYIDTASGSCMPYYFYYRVQAFNSYGDSAYSNIAMGGYSNFVPEAPTNFVATVITPHQINLTWNSSCFASGFRLESATAPSGPFTQVSSSLHTGLSDATTYYYRLSASNNAGTSPYVYASATTWPGGRHIWSYDFGGSDETRDSASPKALAIDRSGNIVIAGDCQGTIHFGGGGRSCSGALSFRAPFLAKYSSAGAHLWSKTFDGSYHRYGDTVGVDGDGNVYFAGTFAETIDLGGGLLRAVPYGTTMFLAKFGPAGNHLWSKAFPGSAPTGQSYEISKPKLAVTATGEIFITGKQHYTIDFGGGPLNTILGMFLVRFDRNGAHLWSRVFTPSTFNSVASNAIVLDRGGNVVVAGNFYGAIDFGGGPLLGDGTDIFLASFSDAGSHRWSKKYGGPGSQYAYGAAVDPAGNILLTGSSGQPFNFDGIPLPNDGDFYPLYVAKLTPSGTAIWAKGGGYFHTSGGTGCVGYAIAADEAGNAILTGACGSGSQTLIVKLMEDGRWQWTKQPPGAGYDSGTAIATEGDRIVVSGYFSRNIDFGGGVLYGGSIIMFTDVFLVKFGP